MDNYNISIKSKKVKRLVNINLQISFFVCLIGIIMLWIRGTYYISIYLLDASVVVFRTGLLIGVASIIYGIFFEKYLKCE